IPKPNAAEESASHGARQAIARLHHGGRALVSVLQASSGGPAAPARSVGLIFSTLNFVARSRIVLNTSSNDGASPLIHRSGLIRATTKERKYGLTSPRSFSLLTTAATFSSNSSTIAARFSLTFSVARRGSSENSSSRRNIE